MATTTDLEEISKIIKSHDDKMNEININKKQPVVVLETSVTPRQRPKPQIVVNPFDVVMATNSSNCSDDDSVFKNAPFKFK